MSVQHIGSCRTFKPGTSSTRNFSREEDDRVQLMGENENFSEEEFRTKLRDYLEEGDRATATVETAPAPSASIGMFMPSSAPELRRRKNLAMFLERFYTWASEAGCNSALDPDVSIKTSGTPRAELECIESHRPTAQYSTCGRADTMLGVFDSQGHPRVDTVPHHVPGSGSTRPGPHRHRGTVPGSLGRLAVRRHVCG